jgi:hypothetical protein
MEFKDEYKPVIVFVLVIIAGIIIINSANDRFNETDKKLNLLQSEVNKPAKIEIKEPASDNSRIQEPLKNSLKILKTKRGIYSFGLAKIKTEGVKTTWFNNGNSPIYGLSYLFLETKKSGKSYRRADPTRRVILSCEANNKVIVQPGDTFETVDMLYDQTVKYQIKLLEINPIAQWYQMAKVDCQGNQISIPYYKGY